MITSTRGGHCFLHVPNSPPLSESLVGRSHPRRWQSCRTFEAVTFTNATDPDFGERLVLLYTNRRILLLQAEFLIIDEVSPV